MNVCRFHNGEFDSFSISRDGSDATTKCEAI